MTTAVFEEHISQKKHIASLHDAIINRTARIAVMGLGYVGLPTAITFAQSGFPVCGIEIDTEKCRALNAGKSHVQGLPDEAIKEMADCGRFRVTTSASALADADVVLICVPTPLRKSKDPDLTAILEAAHALSDHMHAGMLVVLESTTYPGTTEEILLPMLQANGLRAGEDFCLAFSPERIDPGNEKFDVSNITKLVGAVSPLGREIAALLYRQIVQSVVPVSSPRVAEAAKLLENTFRSVNIALANEMAIICRYLEVDVWEVIDAAATKPFGFMAHYPGPGIGGHCIPLDPHYLSWKARLSGYEPRFIALASRINGDMPQYVIDLITLGLNDLNKSVRGSRVLLLGVSYKRDVGDLRESPALSVIELLKNRGAQVSYSDPYIDTLAIGETIVASEPLTPELVRQTDCVVVVTNHSAFDYGMVAREAAVVIDTRNALRPYAHMGNVRFL